MTEINYISESNTAIIKKRTKAARLVLQEKKGWTINEFADHVIELHPEFNNANGATIIQNSWFGKTPNILMMELMEELVKIIENYDL